MSAMNEFFFLIPILSILFYLVVFGFIIYAVMAALKLAKERNAYLKTIAEELQRRP
ncbi:hypothetical protein QOZ98_001326 [Planomicrobium stackebrandtii]|uniref:CcmD family protein n=1 Tax=Planomicrobium stackebrandtii TaxID=253160 RepID=A0ABU0GV98_9BACL|nr:hypothetical protein [Planomicrobium stackebrandtii]MDQ0428500.1 hypothetical protein [Planomicrobium stackebrandtii]